MGPPLGLGQSDLFEGGQRFRRFLVPAELPQRLAVMYQDRRIARGQIYGLLQNNLRFLCLIKPQEDLCQPVEQADVLGIALRQEPEIFDRPGRLLFLEVEYGSGVASLK